MAKKNVKERLRAIEQEVKALKAELNGSKFKGLGAGDTFELIGLTWKILGITDKGYMCLAERMEDSRRFGSDCNNWAASNLRNYLNTIVCDKICEEIGEENLVEFERDLLSMDGQTEYGKCMDKVSILSFDEYRENRSMIPNAGYYWWLLTPDSTPCNDDGRFVRVVCPSGCINSGRYDFSDCVRPFCIFSSSLFESEE